MSTGEDVKQAKEFIQVLTRARKNLRMYPSNNPIYQKTIEDTFQKMEDYFDVADELKLRIKQNELLLGDQQIYQSASKEDNLALFFFKDGVREITFKRGLAEEELHSFLDILAFDFERENIEDDVVTLMWEKDFQHIKYIVDETVILEDEDYEEKAVQEALDAGPEDDDLSKAYQDAFEAEEVKEMPLIPITDRDLKTLQRYLERDATDKTPKLIDLINRIVDSANADREMDDLVYILQNTVEFSIERGDLSMAVQVLKKGRAIAGKTHEDEAKNKLRAVFTHAGSAEMIRIIGEMLDQEDAVNETAFNEYISFLGKSAIPQFIAVLGELKSISARKVIINALMALGSKDITSLAVGLKDNRWYVVRNIIYIMRKIGDKRAVEYLTKALKHNDVRVRKEVLTALGELGGQATVPTIRESLDDPDHTVRSTAIRTLAKIGTETCKRIIFDRIQDKKFGSLDFNEKKEYFEALAHWKDEHTYDFFIKTLKKTSIFKRGRTDENRACAAYGLGLLGRKDAVPVLQKLRSSKNTLLSEYAYTAMRRLEYGK